VYAKLNSRLSANGTVTIHEIFFCAAMKKTVPNVMAIPMYNTVQTGPKIDAGGAQDGLMSCWYHV
jgi:hypothetical protein